MLITSSHQELPDLGNIITRKVKVRPVPKFYQLQHFPSPLKTSPLPPPHYQHDHHHRKVGAVLVVKDLEAGDEVIMIFLTFKSVRLHFLISARMKEKVWDPHHYLLRIWIPATEPNLRPIKLCLKWYKVIKWRGRDIHVWCFQRIWLVVVPGDPWLWLWPRQLPKMVQRTLAPKSGKEREKINAKML